MKFHIGLAGIAIYALSTLSTIAMAHHHHHKYSKYSFTKNGYQFVPGERKFVFDPHTKRWAAYENDRKVKSGIANGGTPDGHETPAGVYRILDKKGPEYLSTRYPINDDGTRGGAQMPYAMHFTKDGHAIHGSPIITSQNTSHGCIRVKTKYAKWLNEEFLTLGTKVIIYPY